MDETTNYDQIQQLIARLDQKVAEINATRTDPSAIASQITANLQGFVGVVISNFLSKKKEEEEELKRPREMIQPVIPIDIVSVSPGAADQIATALEAAGIGKYNIKINQINKQSESDSGGMFSSIIGMVMKVVGWVAKNLAALLTRLGPMLLPLAAGATAIGVGMLFADEISDLLGWAENPEQALQSDQAISTQTSVNSQSTSETDDFEGSSIDFQSISETDDFEESMTDSAPGTPLERFFETETGDEYIQQIESRVEGAEESRARMETAMQMAGDQFDQLYDVDMIEQKSGGRVTGQELRQEYIKAAVAGDLNIEKLQNTAMYMSGDGSTQDKVSGAIDMINQDREKMLLSQAEQQVVIQQAESGAQSMSQYFKSEQYVNSLVQNSDDVTKMQYNMLQQKSQSFAAPDTSTPAPAGETLELPEPSIMPSSQTSTDKVSHLAELIDLSNQELQQSNQQLASIHEALQTIPTQGSSQTNNISTQSETDDSFNVELVRSMVS